MKQKGCLLIIIIIVALAIIGLLTTHNVDQGNSTYFQEIRNGPLGKISFKGRVINYKIVHNDDFGKNYLVMCIKLEYTNTDSFYYFRDKNALIIKNGIATMSGGGYEPNYKPIYVEININNNYKDIFYHADGTKDTFELNFDHTGISKEDMNSCN